MVEDEAVVIRDANDTRLPAVTRERLVQVNAQAIILAPLVIGAEYGGFMAAIPNSRVSSRIMKCVC